MVERIEAIDPQFPKLSDEALNTLEAARAALSGG
jgi:hypothetical protein